MPVTLADIRTRSILSPYLSVHISFGFLLPLLATKNSYLFFYFFLDLSLLKSLLTPTFRPAPVAGSLCGADVAYLCGTHHLDGALLSGFSRVETQSEPTRVSLEIETVL